jgi:hypothetical protein
MSYFSDLGLDLRLSNMGIPAAKEPNMSTIAIAEVLIVRGFFTNSRDAACWADVLA